MRTENTKTQKTRKHNVFFVLLCFCAFVLSVVSVPAQAGELKDDIQAQITAGARPAYGSADIKPQQIAARVINIALGTLGTIFLVLIVMSGYWYITAKGDETKVEKAQSTVRAAIFGLAIVIMAYGITYLVTRRLQGAVQGGRSSFDVKSLRVG